MKKFVVTGKFPQALAKNTFQSVTVEAGTYHAAAFRGVRELFKRDGIKGLRHKQIQIVIQKDVTPAEPWPREA